MSARQTKASTVGDPEPIRWPLSFGLTALLYLRVPVEEPARPPVEDPWACGPGVDPDARRETLDALTPEQLRAFGFELPDGGAA